MATDRAVSQLVLQVDANIAVAQRSLQELARTVNQTTGQMNNALGSTASAHTRLSGAFNQSRLAQMELSHVMTASVDAYAAGASPLRILSLEMGRVAQAASFMGGGNGIMGKVGAFMSGPWGIAVLLATAVLGQLITKLAAGSESVADLVQKMREHAKEAAKSKLADEAWSHSIDGLIERNEKLIDTLKQRLKTQEDVSLQELQAAHRDEATAQKAVTDAQNKLRNLLAQQAASQRSVGIGQGGSPTGSSSVIDAQIARAREELATAQQALGTARAAITQSTIAVGEEQGKALADMSAAVDLWAKRYQSALHGIEQANRGALAGQTETLTNAFESVRKAMGDAASAGAGNAFYSARNQAKDLGVQLEQGKITVAKYATEMQKLASSLEAAAKAARDAKKETGSGEFGKQISFADAANIAKGAGLTVTSAYRSTAHQRDLYNDPSVNRPGNPVARPGTSAHEGVNGKWALDIAFAPGLTPEKIKKIYGDQGVSLSALYKEKGHFHIEGSRSQAAAAENAQARAEQKAKVDDDTFARESAQLDAEILQTKKELAAGYDTQAALATQEIEAQKEAQLASIQKQLDAKQISEAEAQSLRLQVEELAAQREGIVARRKYTDDLEALARSAQQESEFKIADLRFADDMAKTQGEHRSLQLQILDIQYQQKEADLKRLLLTIQSNKDFATSVDLQRQAMEVQAQLARIPIEMAQDQTRVRQGTLDPLQQYLSGIPHEAATINEALKALEVQGLDGLANALSHIGEGWKAMRDIALSTIQDIVSALIKMQIERMFFSLLGGGGGGLVGSLGLGGAGALPDIGGAAIAAGAVPGFFSGGAPFAGFASGGFVSGAGGSTSDSIPAMLSNGEYVMSAEAVRKFGTGFLDAMNEGKIPHKKHGGLLGGLFGGLFGLTGLLATGTLKPKDLLPILSPGLALVTGHAGILKYLSPGGMLASKMFGHETASIPQPSRIAPPRAANFNAAGGNVFYISVTAPNTGNQRRDRATALQQAGLVREAVATANRKGAA